MSNYTPKPNTWTLFSNTKKRDDMSPDYTGTALLELPDGSQVEYRLSAWKRVSKNNVKFLGGFIKPKQDAQQPKLLDDGAGEDQPW